VKLMQRIRERLREAQTLSFADAYLAVGCCCVAATLIVTLMRKVAPPQKPSIDANLDRWGAENTAKKHP